MGAADLGGGAEHVGVTLELPVAAAEDIAGEEHARVARAHDRADVVVRVGRAAHHDGLHAPRARPVDARERLDEQVRVVLGLQAPDEEDVLARLEPQALERLRARVPGVLDAVGHDADAAPVAALEHVRDRVRVGDGLVRPARRRALGEAQVGLRRCRPLAPVRVEAVDVDDGRDPRPTGDQAHGRVAGDEHQRDVGAQPTGSVQRGQERVHEGVQVLVAQGGQVDQARPLPLAQPAVDHVGPAVHGHLVSARGQARGKLLCRGLESRIGRRDPPGPENCDLHPSARV